MTNKSPVITHSGPIENGFTLAEDDDVTFSLMLCQEIHRIYGSYREGLLDASDQVWAGLSLTLTMLDSLQNTVADGMPAMRLKVAAAQAQEIRAVLFGRRPALNGAESRVLLGALDGFPALPSQVADTWRPTQTKPVPPIPSSSGGTATSGRRSVGTRWERTPAALKFAAGLFLCGLMGALIDVPLTLMALFPGEIIPIIAGFVGVPLLIGQLRRLRASPSNALAGMSGQGGSSAGASQVLPFQGRLGQMRNQSV